MADVRTSVRNMTAKVEQLLLRGKFKAAEKLQNEIDVLLGVAHLD